MNERLLEIFPEIKEIIDPALREAVAATWLLGIEEGGWKIDDLERIPFTLLKNTGISFADHVRGVTRCVMAIGCVMSRTYGKRLILDGDTLLAGALLHDVGKLLEIEESGEGFKKSLKGKLLRHPISGTVLAARCGVPDKVLHTIASHSKEGDPFPRTPESVIIHHADFTNFEPFEG